MRRVLGRLPTMAGIYAVVGGLVTVCGWLLNIPRLADWDGDGITMQPNTAIAAMLTGAALLFAAHGSRTVAAWLSSIVVALGLATLSEHAFGVSLSIDQLLLFGRPWGASNTVSPGRMGIPASVSWTLAGYALICLHRSRTSPAVPVIGMIVASIAALSVIGYLFEADLLYTLPRITAIALQTATMIGAIGIGLLVIAPDSEPVRTLFLESAGSSLARRALPIAILLPVGLGLLCVWGQNSLLYDASMAIALLVLSLIFTLCAILWWGTTVLNAREESLRRSEEQFSRFMEHLPGLAWIKSAEGKYVYVNESAEIVFGVHRDLLYGKTDLEVFPKETADEFRKNDREALESHIGLQVVETLKHSDGVVHHSLVNKFPIGVRDGKVPLIGGMAIDITDRKRAAEQIQVLLRISKRLNSTLSVDGLLDILVLDATHLVGAESGVSGLLTPEGMVCKKYFRKGEVLPLEYCWPPTHGLPGWLIVHKVPYLTNNATADKQIIHSLCDQFGVWSALSVPILTAQNELIGFFEIHNKADGSGFTSADQDLLIAVSQSAAIAVQNALAYRSLQEAEESLKQADRRKDDFLALLAHELRNPLAPMRTGLEIIKRAGGPIEAVNAAQDAMERQLLHMVRLVDDLLDLGRISHDKLELRKQRIPAGSVIRQALETTRPLLERESQSVQFTDTDHPILLDADPVRLAQVFSNLLNNASKFSPAGSQIFVKAVREGSDVVVSVKDPGAGIPQQMLEQVFEMFTQIHHPIERVHGGLGIGLALVKRLVEMHGGSVAAKSAGSGQGSEFLVRLPCAIDVEAPVPVFSPAPAMIVPLPRKILVVDDNRDAATTLSLLFSLTGDDVRLAHDGAEACHVAEAYRPDVILLDIGLPKMNGYEACRAMRQMPGVRDAVIIALTGWSQEEDRRQSMDAGFDEHLVKPVDHERLQQLLNEKLAVPNQV